MINWTEKEEISWIPPMRDKEHGWLLIEGKSWMITKWHHFDDFGQTIETVTVKHPYDRTEMEVYSIDEGLTWHTELA